MLIIHLYIFGEMSIQVLCPFLRSGFLYCLVLSSCPFPFLFITLAKDFQYDIEKSGENRHSYFNLLLGSIQSSPLSMMLDALYQVKEVPFYPELLRIFLMLIH